MLALKRLTAALKTALAETGPVLALNSTSIGVLFPTVRSGTRQAVGGGCSRSGCSSGLAVVAAAGVAIAGVAVAVVWQLWQ